jgi:RNA ligase (TIGR02306 family)
MSSLIVEVCDIQEIADHPNADRLERIRVKNWWCIAPIGQYKVGDKVVYLPPDSVIPEELAEQWGIAKYCAPLARGPDGKRPPKLRIRASRFRGEPSFGCIQDLDDPSWPVGHDVKEYYKVEKWEPPLKSHDGDAAPPVPAFHAYTDIENIGNFPGILQDNERVVVTEKIHGTNCRVGYVKQADEDGYPCWEWMAGSHGVRRKEYDPRGARSRYWFPFSADAEEDDEDNLKCLIEHIISREHAENAVIVFGEIFGEGVQDMHYGQSGIAFRVFDISVDGKYLDYDLMLAYLGLYSISAVPVLYEGPFSMSKMDELVDGPTTVCDPKSIKQPFKGREGIVIRPVKERYNFDLGGSGRVVLKYISADYHARGNEKPTENH